VAGKQAAVVEVGDELEEDQSDHLDHHLWRILPKQSVLLSAGTVEPAVVLEQIAVEEQIVAVAVEQTVVEEQTAVVVEGQTAAVVEEQTAVAEGQTAVVEEQTAVVVEERTVVGSEQTADSG